MTVATQLVEINEKLVKGPCYNSFNSYFCLLNNGEFQKSVRGPQLVR